MLVYVPGCRCSLLFVCLFVAVVCYCCCMIRLLIVAVSGVALSVVCCCWLLLCGGVVCGCLFVVGVVCRLNSC